MAKAGGEQGKESEKIMEDEKGCPLDRGPKPRNLSDEAAGWIIPFQHNLENVKCKNKFSKT